jgi:hypothetical protein
MVSAWKKPTALFTPDDRKDYQALKEQSLHTPGKLPAYAPAGAQYR